MLTIHNLEVSFDVEGESDAAVFARLFKEHTRDWEETKTRRRMTDLERSLGDRAAEEGEPC